jgi:Ca2+-binding RTX toxin-like protein
VVTSGAGNDVVLLDGGNDNANAGQGNDSVAGGEGNDTLTGAGGNDTLDGGSGNDRIDARSGQDLVYDGAGSDLVLMSARADTRVENAEDHTRDVFRWTALEDVGSTDPTTNSIAYFDVYGPKTNDQLDFSAFDNLYAEVYGSAEDSGAFVIYHNAVDALLGRALLTVEWDNGTLVEDINIGVQSNADIRIGYGWTVVDAIGNVNIL